jgi:hypothetical protein
MSIYIKSVSPVTAHNVSDYGLKNYKHWLPATAYYFEEAPKYKVNALILVAWAIVRSEKFTSKAYNENQDIFALGGHYQSYRDSISCGANELAKFESTGMMQEQEEVEKIYQAIVDWSNGTQPVIVPPKPPEPPKPPKPDYPTQPEEPKPSEPEKPSGGTSWKTSLGWLGGVASALLVVWGIVSLALPSWAGLAGKAVLQIIVSVFGG